MHPLYLFVLCPSSLYSALHLPSQLAVLCLPFPAFLLPHMAKLCLPYPTILLPWLYSLPPFFSSSPLLLSPHLDVLCACPCSFLSFLLICTLSSPHLLCSPPSFWLGSTLPPIPCCPPSSSFGCTPLLILCSPPSSSLGYALLHPSPAHLIFFVFLTGLYFAPTSTVFFLPDYILTPTPNLLSYLAELYPPLHVLSLHQLLPSPFSMKCPLRSLVPSHLP